MEELSKYLSKIEIPEYENILTPEEEKVHIEKAIKSKIEHSVWVLKQKGWHPQKIEDFISKTDFLNEIDHKSVLRDANNRKHWAMEDEQRKIEKERIELEQKIKRAKEWDYAAAYNFIKRRSKLIFEKDFLYKELSQSQQRYIQAICFFISKDPRFETEFGYSFKKGILTRGTTGVGKTYIIKCLSENEYNPISMFSMIRISNEIKKSESGNYFIKPGSKIIYIDDVGTGEEVINHFGSKINWFQEFIELMNYEQKTFSNLIISMNLNFDEVENKFGFRVRSRIAEMFNIIDVDGVDLRKS